MRRYKLFFLTMLFLMCPAMVNSGTVTQQEALQKAQQVIKGKTLTLARSQVMQARTEGASADESDFYIFNAENRGGFVIVSADDRTEAVLGYSDEGYIDLDNLPDNLRYWLDGYKSQIRMLDEGATPARKASTRADKAAIEPLVKTSWGQDYPYKGQCPIYKEVNCVTGCVATAMAQLMYFYQYPAESPALPAYLTNTYKFSLEALPKTTFKWDKIRTTYSMDALGETADAVAELMRYCGQAVGMDYGLSGSSANSESMVYGLVNYFGYDKNARIITRANYSVTQWEDMIYRELSTGHPVAYSGQDPYGGHAFICDGYDGNGLFHFNWGWNGTANGYFVASLANHKSQRRGEHGSLDGYSINQSAIIGIYPDAGEKAIPVITNEVVANPATYTRTSRADDFNDVNLQSFILAKYRFEPTEYDVEAGWGIYLGDECLDVIGQTAVPFGKAGESFQTLEYTSPTDYFFTYTGLYRTIEGQYSFGGGLTDGTYQLKQVYRPVGETNWRLCEPLRTDISYLVADIGEQSMTLRSADNNQSFVVNGVWTSDAPAQGEPLRVTVSLTNTGDTYQELLYLFFDDKHESTLMASVEPGKTGEVTLSFIPTSYGLSKEIVIKDIYKKELWRSTVESTREMEEGFFDESTNYYEFQDDGESIVLVTVNQTTDGRLVIPASISHHGKDYKVVGIKSSDHKSICKDPDELLEVVVPSTVRFIGDFAFYFCMNLTSFTWDHIEESELTEIGMNAFTSCINLKAMTLPAGLSSIGESCISGCISLPAFVLDESCVSFTVVDGLLYNKEKTTLVTCPAGKAGTVTLPSTVTNIEANAFYNCTGLKEIILPEGLESIGLATFVGCSSLKALTIPASVTYIGFGSFTGCTSLETIGVESGNTKYSSWDGVLVEEGNRLLAYPNKKGVKYEVPEELYIIETLAFCWTDIQEVVLPSYVWFGNMSLAYCHDLISIRARQRIPNEITDDCFSEETYEKATLYVPEGAVEQYRSTPGWKNFARIVEEGDDTSIRVSPTDDEAFDVYDLSGRKVRTGITNVKKLPKGIYIINGKKVVK